MATNLRLTSLSVKHLNVTDNIRINGQFFAGNNDVVGVSSLVVNRDNNDNITNNSLLCATTFFNLNSYQGGLTDSNGRSTLLSVFGDLIVGGGFSIGGSYIPTTSKSKGKRGTITFDEDYIYVCVKDGEDGDAEWRRTSLSTWTGPEKDVIKKTTAVAAAIEAEVVAKLQSKEAEEALKKALEKVEKAKEEKKKTDNALSDAGLEEEEAKNNAFNTSDEKETVAHEAALKEAAEKLKVAKAQSKKAKEEKEKTDTVHAAAFKKNTEATKAKEAATEKLKIAIDAEKKAKKDKLEAAVTRAKEDVYRASEAASIASKVLDEAVSAGNPNGTALKLSKEAVEAVRVAKALESKAVKNLNDFKNS